MAPSQVAKPSLSTATLRLSPICPVTHPPSHPSAQSPICPSVHLPIRPSAHPPICLLPCHQERVFTMAGLPVVENCLAGYNGTVFAYGQVSRQLSRG